MITTVRGKMIRSLAGLAVAAAATAAFLAGMASVPSQAGEAAAGAGAYACPACGCDNDGKAFDKPGRCEACNMKLVRKDEARDVAILLFEGVQIIDYTGPYEVFGQVGAFNVYTVSETGETLSTAMDMSVNPKYSFADAPDPDILVVPGGAAHVAYDNPKVIEWVKAKAETAEYVLSVCNGAFILAKAGLLAGKKATTFYGLIDDLREFAPETEVVSDRRFVDNGKVITSAGLSSGIDASLHLVSRIRGMARAKRLALHLEYDWSPESTFARASLADLKLPDLRPPEGAETTLVATSGDRDRWERTHRVASAMSVEELRGYVIEQLSALKGWRRAGRAGASSGGAVEWAYREPDGTLWEASISFTPGEDATMVTMTIERAGPRQAARR